MNFKKIRKLIKSPVLFFLDSKILRCFFGFRSLGYHKLIDELLFTRTVDENKGSLIYFSWIIGHGDSLIDKINAKDAKIVSIDIFRFSEFKNTRSDINNFVRNNPDYYLTRLIELIAPYAENIQGVVFTLDWPPALRLLVYACRSVGIHTVLVPHEAVFASRLKYYTDVVSGADYPICDEVLAWGKLQKEIFVERGFPSNKILITGSPKFDVYHEYRPSLTRREFCALYDLDENLPIFLFAMQPLDSQFDTNNARNAQNLAIRHLADYSSECSFQLIVRYPPSGVDFLEETLKKDIQELPRVVLDDSNPYISEPHDSIFYSLAVVSVNSTMLLESILMGRAAISTKYINFNQIWAHVGIKSVSNEFELIDAIRAIQSNPGENLILESGLKWAAESFSIGEFDGQGAMRVKEKLHSIGSNLDQSLSNEILSLLFSDEACSHGFGVIGFYSNVSEKMRYVPEMLSFRKLLVPLELKSAVQCDFFVKWGISETENKKRVDFFSQRLKRPLLIIEDGFLRSIGIGLSGDPALSIIIDTETAYYDAGKASGLENRLNSNFDLSDNQKTRCKACIKEIVTNRLSKYNHAPDLEVETSHRDHKVLLIDQRFNDQSVSSGLANEETFLYMLQTAINDFPDSDILIKRHPDAITGGRQSYFCDSNVQSVVNLERIHLIDYEINPYSLFDVVDDVFVVTSGMGFEALLAGKVVHCFGVPFYSNWGVTNDKVRIERRVRDRSIEEIFFFSYIEASRYYDPDIKSVAQIEDVIEYIKNNR